MPLTKINKLLKYKVGTNKTLMCNYQRKTKPEDNWSTPIVDTFSRTKKGSHYLDKLRDFGLVPCELKMADNKNLKIAIPHKQANSLVNTFGFSSSLIVLRLHEKLVCSAGEINFKDVKVIPKDVNYHPISQEPLNLVFEQFVENKAIKMTVPVFFENVAYCKGVKKQNGALKILNDRLKCVYKGTESRLPKFFRIDVKNVELNRGVNVIDVNFPKELKPIYTSKLPPKFCKVVHAKKEVVEETKKDEIVVGGAKDSAKKNTKK